MPWIIAHRIEWLTEKDKIIANADPIEIPAVAAFPFALICSPRVGLVWISKAKPIRHKCTERTEGTLLPVRARRANAAELQDHLGDRKRHYPANPRDCDVAVIFRAQACHRAVVAQDAEEYEGKGHNISANHPFLVKGDQPFADRVICHGR